jgi:hypothetical protein
MALFYSGKRPVLKGRDADQNINTYTNEVEEYSNWSLMNPSHVLDGIPATPHTPGDGYHPHGLNLTRYYNGDDSESRIRSLRDAGSGVRIDGMRYRPLENKAAGNNLVFGSSYGHEPRATDYSLIDPYDDTDRQRRLDDPGHAIRAIDATGTAASFGYFDPYVYKGVTTVSLGETTQAYPTDFDHEYGKNRVNEWRGVTSAKALDV